MSISYYTLSCPVLVPVSTHRVLYDNQSKQPIVFLVRVQSTRFFFSRYFSDWAFSLSQMYSLLDTLRRWYKTIHHRDAGRRRRADRYNFYLRGIIFVRPFVTIGHGEQEHQCRTHIS